MKADLHMHSTHSDGRFTTFELVDMAVAHNVKIIAITDHDVVGPLDETIEYGKQRGLRVLPAIELSTLEQGKSVHVLGYFTDQSYQSEELRNYFKDIKEKRETRAKKIIRNLSEMYNIQISYDRVYAFAKGIIARPHIAKAISEQYPEYTHDYIFQHFIGDDCEAYVPSVELPVLEGIELLKRNHCVAVLAHPTLLKPHIKETVMNYPFDGLEARYPLNKEFEEEHFIQFAKERQMIITGGSDFHGIPRDTKHGQIGDVIISGHDLEVFLQKIEKN